MHVILLQEIAKYLLEHKADTEKKFQNGYTPLHIAVAENRKNIVEVLLENGASPISFDEKEKVPVSVQDEFLAYSSTQTPLDLAEELNRGYIAGTIKKYMIES